MEKNLLSPWFAPANGPFSKFYVLNPSTLPVCFQASHDSQHISPCTAQHTKLYSKGWCPSSRGKVWLNLSLYQGALDPMCALCKELGIERDTCQDSCLFLSSLSLYSSTPQLLLHHYLLSPKWAASKTFLLFKTYCALEFYTCPFFSQMMPSLSS